MRSNSNDIENQNIVRPQTNEKNRQNGSKARDEYAVNVRNMLSRKRLENNEGPKLHFVTNIEGRHRSSITNLKYSKSQFKKSRINAYGQSF